MPNTFRALIVSEEAADTFTHRIGERSVDELPAGDLLIRVHYSSLNYKDALSATGARGVTRHYPHTPGIDAAGQVVESHHPDFAPGDEVIAIGYDLGVNTPGGFGEMIRIPAGWAVKRPAGLSLRESMILGTAGFTAAQCVQGLIQAGVVPEDGPVVVSGATGGVGSVAVALLAKLGYDVTAATGKLDQEAYLRELGAAAVIGRREIDDDSGRPMPRTVWAGAVDTVGGNTLATLIKTTHYRGAVTACGLVAGSQLNTTVFPFILRQVSLLGIDSVHCPLDERAKIWHRLADHWKLPQLETIAREIKLEEIEHEFEKFLGGRQRGRVVVNLG